MVVGSGSGYLVGMIARRVYMYVQYICIIAAQVFHHRRRRHRHHRWLKRKKIIYMCVWNISCNVPFLYIRYFIAYSYRVQYAPFDKILINKVYLDATQTWATFTFYFQLHL